MHRSGINVDAEVKDAVQAAFNDAGVGFVRVGIENEAFAVLGTGAATGSVEGDFTAAASELVERDPVYVLVKNGDAKWVMVNFVPSNAPVKAKMLFASSRSALKEGLGAGQFAEDYFVLEREELTHKDYLRSLETHEDEHLMTSDEIAKRDAHHSSLREQGGGSTKAAMQDLPLKVEDSAQQALERFAAGGDDAVLLTLDPATETLVAEECKATEPAAVGAAFKPKEPQYAVFRFAHTHNDKQQSPVLFVFSCPDSCPPRAKMISASFRGMVQRVVEAAGVTVDKSLEVTQVSELSNAAVLDELHPKEAVDTKFKKPTRPGRAAAGRGRRRMHGNVKFNAEG